MRHTRQAAHFEGRVARLQDRIRDELHALGKARGYDPASAAPWKLRTLATLAVVIECAERAPGATEETVRSAARQTVRIILARARRIRTRTEAEARYLASQVAFLEFLARGGAYGTSAKRRDP